MLNELRARVLSLSSDAPDDAFQQAICELDAAKAQIKEIGGLLDGAMMERIEQKGEVTLGSKRYYVGTSTKVKVKDNEAALEALLEATGGDLGLLASMLSSNPWKHGACREPLGDRWAEVFDSEVEKDVKTGAPRKKVQCIDDEFIRSGDRKLLTRAEAEAAITQGGGDDATGKAGG